jgi:hypothetical protein
MIQDTNYTFSIVTKTNGVVTTHFAARWENEGGLVLPDVSRDEMVEGLKAIEEDLR